VQVMVVRLVTASTGTVSTPPNCSGNVPPDRPTVSSLRHVHSIVIIIIIIIVIVYSLNRKL